MKKLIIVFKSSNNDNPEEVLISEPMTFLELMSSYENQINFVGGSSLGSYEITEDEEGELNFMLFTGKLDKNNNEIYEGQEIIGALKVDDENDFIPLKGYIEYDVEKAQYVLNSYSYKCILSTIKNIELTGRNIYSNPEILKK